MWHLVGGKKKKKTNKSHESPPFLFDMQNQTSKSFDKEGDKGLSHLSAIAGWTLKYFIICHGALTAVLQTNKLTQHVIVRAMVVSQVTTVLVVFFYQILPPGQYTSQPPNRVSFSIFQTAGGLGLPGRTLKFMFKLSMRSLLWNGGIWRPRKYEKNNVFFCHKRNVWKRVIYILTNLKLLAKKN